MYVLVGRKFLGWETLVKSEEAFSKNTDDSNIFLIDSDELGIVSIAFQTGSKNKTKHWLAKLQIGQQSKTYPCWAQPWKKDSALYAERRSPCQMVPGGLIRGDMAEGRNCSTGLP